MDGNTVLDLMVLDFVSQAKVSGPGTRSSGSTSGYRDHRRKSSIEVDAISTINY